MNSLTKLGKLSARTGSAFMNRSGAQRGVATRPGDIDWENLGFDYVETKSVIMYNWKDGKWDEGKEMDKPYIELHALSNVLHYGQSIFEGLKAFHNKNNKIHVFNGERNADRLRAGANRLGLQDVPVELFNEAVDRAIEANVEYIPPLGTGGSLYIRPFLFGTRWTARVCTAKI